MKVSSLEDAIEIDSIGEIISTDASISLKNISFAIAAISKGLYSDIIPSIVRELTSNAIDANLLAGTDNPVIVKIVESEHTDSVYFSVVDEGVGMSPEFIKNNYMDYFSSEKRLSNDFIGGFGIGSKSPLGYTDHFFITTIYDHVEYSYVLNKTETLPKISLLSSSTTEKRNGTIVSIEIQLIDIKKFSLSIINQLWYFNKVVYFTNLQNTLKDASYFNERRIFEHPLFYINKFNTDDSSNSVISNYSFFKLHIVLGNVIYKMDYNVIIEYLRKSGRLDTCHFAQSLKMGLKFNIGELNITLNRENIEYTESTLEIISCKYVEVFNLLKNYLIDSEQHIHNIYDYVNNRNDIFKVRFVNNNTQEEVFGHLELSKNNWLPLLHRNYIKNYNYVDDYFTTLKGWEHTCFSGIVQIRFHTLDNLGIWTVSKSKKVFRTLLDMVRNYQDGTPYILNSDINLSNTYLDNYIASVKDSKSSVYLDRLKAFVNKEKHSYHNGQSGFIITEYPGYNFYKELCKVLEFPEIGYAIMLYKQFIRDYKNNNTAFESIPNEWIDSKIVEYEVNHKEKIKLIAEKAKETRLVNKEKEQDQNKIVIDNLLCTHNSIAHYFSTYNLDVKTLSEYEVIILLNASNHLIKSDPKFFDDSKSSISIDDFLRQQLKLLPNSNILIISNITLSNYKKITKYIDNEKIIYSYDIFLQENLNKSNQLKTVVINSLKSYLYSKHFLKSNSSVERYLEFIGGNRIIFDKLYKEKILIFIKKMKELLNCDRGIVRNFSTYLYDNLNKEQTLKSHIQNIIDLFITIINENKDEIDLLRDIFDDYDNYYSIIKNYLNDDHPSELKHYILKEYIKFPNSKLNSAFNGKKSVKQN